MTKTIVEPDGGRVSVGNADGAHVSSSRHRRWKLETVEAFASAEEFWRRQNPAGGR